MILALNIMFDFKVIDYICQASCKLESNNL